MKVRVALEGINATVGGSMQAIIEYVSKVISHPFPHQISLEDVKVCVHLLSCVFCV